MSKQAFEKLLSELSQEDKTKIYAAAVAYGLDFESPEWIPFAISQHGLLSIEQAIVDLRAAVTESSNFAIKQIMKALTVAKDVELAKLQAAAAVSQAAVEDAAEKACSAIDVYSAAAQAKMTRDVQSSIQTMVDNTFNRQAHRIDAVQRSLVDSLTSAEGRIGQIRTVGTHQVLGWAAIGSLIGGIIMSGFMYWMINQGHVQQPQAKISLDGKGTGQYIIDAMRRK